MAVENIALFQEKISKNKSLKKEVKKLSAPYEGSDDELLVVEKVLIPLAQEHKLPFTLQEYKSLYQDSEVEEGELSDDDLDFVSGGQDFLAQLEMAQSRLKKDDDDFFSQFFK